MCITPSLHLLQFTFTYYSASFYISVPYILCMKGQSALFSSVKNNSKGASDDWETPDDLFNILNNALK